MKWLALDVGGANLKVADGKGYANSYRFQLWKNHGQLARELRSLITESPACDHLALTMTGELADCFETRVEGVQFIIRAAEDAADGRPIRVYTVDGKLVAPPVAMARPVQAASSNWHALARYAGRFAPHGNALTIDVGSTTCDVVPLENGVPAPGGLTDVDRLLVGELVYTGVERSPVCGIVHEVPYRGRVCPVAQELFATSRDVYLTLGDFVEEPSERGTADGRPATKDAARVRLGRMVGALGEQFVQSDADAMARAVADAQVQLVATAIHQVLDRMRWRPSTLVLSGHGTFLIRRAVERAGLQAALVPLASELSREVSRCAPAHALAVLATESVAP